MRQSAANRRPVEAHLSRLEDLVVASVAVTARAVADAAPELSMLQWRVLVILSGAPDGATVSELAERTGSRLPAASRLLSRMRARGLVEARQDQDDGRVRTVRLAPAGGELHARVAGRRREDLVEALAEARLEPAAVDGLDRLALALGKFA